MSRLTVVPGDITSERAGSLLLRGAPVIVRFDASASIHGVCLMLDVVAVRDGGMSDIYEVGLGELYDIAPDQVALDLSDDLGMDIAARWLARHHGLTVGATAPEWSRHPIMGGEPRSYYWSLFGDHGKPFHDCDGVYWRTDYNAVRIPGISAPTDPAAALRLAILAAAGRDDG